MKNIKEFLQTQGIKPSKIRGQNFLISEDVLSKIINAADLKSDDTILEIGPGLGVLTKELIKYAGRVIAVESDQKFYKILKDIFKDANNLELVNTDILKLSSDEIRKLCGNKEYKIIANIPYNITSEILIKFLSEDPRPKLMVVMVQKEVAERIVEKDSKSSRLSIFVNYFGKPKIVAKVSASCFWPQPKVDSAILKIETHDGVYKNDKVCEKSFFDFVKLGFSHPRKKILSNLSAKFDRRELEKMLKNVHVDINSRPENLNLSSWQNLFNGIKKEA